MEKEVIDRIKDRTKAGEELKAHTKMMMNKSNAQAKKISHKRYYVIAVSIIVVVGLYSVIRVLIKQPIQTNDIIASKPTDVKKDNEKELNIVNSEQPIDNSEDIIYTVEGKFDLIHNYAEIGDLVKDSTYVIEGSIKSKNSYVRESGLVLTDYVFTIKSIVHGDIIDSNEIIFTEVGGIVTYSEYAEINNIEKDFDPPIKPMNKNAKIKYVFDGAPLLEIGKNYIIFVESIIMDGKLTNCIVGNYQGVFYETDDGRVERYYTGNGVDKIGKQTKSEFIKNIK